MFGDESSPSLPSQMFQCGEVGLFTELSLGLLQSIPVGLQRNGWQIAVERTLTVENLIESAAAEKIIKRCDVLVVAQASQFMDTTVRWVPLIGLKQQG